MEQYADLLTLAGENLGERAWQEYPRPTLRRESYLNLNGSWEFATGKPGKIPEAFPETIRVPFPPESLLSGIHRRLPRRAARYYRRVFTLPGDFRGERVLLHFGGVDQVCRVTLNGCAFGVHRGGYSPFTLDITDALRQENTLIVQVEDDPWGIVLPYGKQRAKRGGIWYTPFSGIWQTVWLESVPREHIRSLRFTTRENRVELTLEGVREGTLRYCGGEVPIKGGRAAFTVENPRFWSPEEPYLYDVTVTAGEDRVQSYFALRDLDVRQVDGVQRLCLNGKPRFFHGVLDQGYWSDGLVTPASYGCMTEDILAMKRLGFNMLRKHIKVEPELYYYACDRLGMVVFQDMVNNGSYRYILDTVLPTLGYQTRRQDERMHRNRAARQAFRTAMGETAAFLYNHPSVCYYTIFNEGWGQFQSGRLYRELKALDNTRFVDTASGWFRCGESDVESLHVYFRPVRITPGEKPVVLSEYGGYVLKIAGHSFNLKKTYGYKYFQSREVFMDALENLYRQEILPAAAQGLCADVYTQLSDVEDETNGILTYDRRVCKADEERMRRIGQDLYGQVEKV